MKRFRKNSWAWIVVLLVGVLLTMPSAAIAGTYDSITITATGAEINIRVNTSAWAIGFVYADTVYTTGDLDTAAWATMENLGGEAVDITVHGHDMKDSGNSDTWDLSDDGSNGADTIGMYAGLNDGDDTFDVVIREAESYNYLWGGAGAELAASSSQEFGLQFESPTSMSTYEAMEMVGDGGTVSDNPRGVVFTGTVD